jgi:DNA-directed RNA polymerase subunit M/transcription elongation factor TFIIS
MPQQQLAQITMIEMQKTSDALLIANDCGSDKLVRALTIYDLHGNQEIESWKQILIAQQESDAKKLKASVTPSTEDQNDMIKEAMRLGAAQIKSD